MRISGVWYTVKQGLKNIYKNKMFSLASIGTMASCIFLFGVFFAVVANFKSVMSEIESGVAITVFFEPNLSEEEILQIGAKIEKRSEVSDMHYVSAEAAWDQFKSEYFGNKPELADAFERGLHSSQRMSCALRQLDDLLQAIYRDRFESLTEPLMNQIAEYE